MFVEAKNKEKKYERERKRNKLRRHKTNKQNKKC